MFSSRLSWETAPNSLLTALAEKRAAGVEIIDLTESNPTRAGFTYDQETLLAALADPEGAVYEPSPRGLPAARQAVADYYRTRGKTIHPDSIFLTASTSEAYSFLFRLLADPGDEILVPQPSYPLLDFLAALDSVRPSYYSLNYQDGHGWVIDLSTLRSALTPRTRAVVVVNPNNPTGSYLKRNELAALNTLCAERGLALIVDEVFSDYASRSPKSPTSTDAGDDEVRTTVGNAEALTFVLSGLSKVAGLPQVKLGWIQISGPESLCVEAASRLEFIADTYLSVSASVQHAAPTLLAARDSIQQQILDRVESNFEWLRAQCAGRTRCRLLKRETGWYGLLEFHDSVSDDERVNILLERDDVFVHPGYFYDFGRDGFLVVSLLTASGTFQVGISRILARWGK